MKFVKYHKIRQFRDVIKQVEHSARFQGLDEKGEPIYLHVQLPKLTFKGTIKLHGTNAQICYNPNSIPSVKIGKRSSLIGLEQLNAHFEFNRFVQVTRQQEIINWLNTYEFLSDNEQLCIYGEWAGQSIQKGVGISELPKSFYIFDACIYNTETEETKWLDVNTDFFYPGIKGVYNIHNFDTYTRVIDFENPKSIQNELIELTSKVEEECPVAKALGKEGIGEGIVWTSFYKGEKLIFKVKGEKHSSSKTKTLVEVDPVKLKNITDFVNRVCTESRVVQGMQETECDTRSKTGDFLRWFANDVISEESSVLEENNLEWKDVVKQVSNRARLMMFVELDKI